jgi:predicted ATPase
MTLGLDIAIRNRRGIRAIRRCSSRNVAVKLSFESPESRIEYSFELGSGKGEEYRIKSEECIVYRANGTVDRLKVIEGKLTEAPDIFKSVSWPEPVRTFLFPVMGIMMAPEAWNTIQSMRIYHPEPSIVRTSTEYLMTVSYPLSERGENLPFVLWTLQKDFPQSFQEICDILKVLVPSIKALKVSSSSSVLLEHGDDHKTASKLELWQESDGTLRILALLTALYQQPPVPMLVVEEPELTVHPSALAVLVDLLVSQSALQQVLITTHSPDLLSYLPAETLRIVEFVEGETRIGPLEEHQKAVIAKKYFTIGDLLRIEGLRRELPEPVEKR